MICGAGHVSIPVIRIGRMIGCTVTVLEDRPRFADNARRAGADTVLCEPFEEGLKKIPGDTDTYFVIVTRGHRYDQMCLEKIMKKEHAYIGMMGSRARTVKVKQALLEQGADPQVLESVHTPIGLPIGGETPEEIGVSIIAEIIQEKNRSRKRGGFTKEILRAILDEEEKDMKKVLATIVTKKRLLSQRSRNKNAGLPGWPDCGNHRRGVPGSRYPSEISPSYVPGKPPSCASSR